MHQSQSIHTVLTEIRDVLTEIRDELKRARARPSRSALLAAIAGAVDERAFTSAELIAHGGVDAALDAALTAAGIATAKQLGRILKSIEGRAIGAYRLMRIGTDHDGAIVWRVRR